MKVKTLNDLSLKEFDKYKELIVEEKLDLEEVFKLFGYDITEMDVAEMRKIETLISGMSLYKGGVKKVYNINGRRFKAQLNLTNISASQFIDYQMYLNPFDLKCVLSVILIPQKRSWFGWITPKYNDGYDIFEVQNYLYNNFTIGEANNLSNFFFQQSEDLLRVMKGYLEKKKVKMKMKQIKTQLNQK